MNVIEEMIVNSSADTMHREIMQMPETIREQMSLNFVAGFKILMTNMGSSNENVEILANALIARFSELMKESYKDLQ